jgi:MFS family permease
MIVSLTIVVSRAITSPLLTLFLSNKLGLDQQDVGLLLGIAVFTATLLALYGGYVIDRLEKRRLLILAMLSSAIGFVLLTFAENLYLTTLTVVITETASALFLIGSKAILSENLPIGQRAKAFSLRYTLPDRRGHRVCEHFPDDRHSCGPRIETGHVDAAQFPHDAEYPEK